MERLHQKRETVQAFFAEVANVRIASEVTAADVMTPEPECLSIHATALDIVRKFHATGFRHLLLADEQNRLAGVISDRDVIRCFGMDGAPSSDELQRIRAGDLMSSDLLTVNSTTPLDRVVGLMVDEGISCVPVLDDGRLVGILTNSDLFIVLQSLLSLAWSESDEDVAVSASSL